MGSKSNKISIRITPWQGQVLSEMCDSLGVGYSMLIRTIVGDWLQKHEEQIYRIIDRKKIENAYNQQNTEEAQDFLRED